MVFETFLFEILTHHAEAVSVKWIFRQKQLFPNYEMLPGCPWDDRVGLHQLGRWCQGREGVSLGHSDNKQFALG